MPALIQRKTQVHTQERNCAENSCYLECGAEGWVEGRGRGEHFVRGREEHEEGEVGGEEMGFEEEV